MRFLDTILEIVFPAKCLLCGERGMDLCPECLHEMPVAERENMKWISSLYDYRHPAVKKSLWLLKYKGKKGFAKLFAKIIYEKILEELSDLAVMENFNNPVLLPIPLSRKRLHERGYNQTQLICEELMKINSRRDGLNLELMNNLLIKPKETEHQARLKDRRARLKNLVGSFAIKNTGKNLNKIKNRNIILIDDVTTTGATLNEARKVLKTAGARKVIAFTVAH